MPVNLHFEEKELEDLYNSIFQRKSVRNYKSETLPEEALNEINDFVAGAKRLNEDIRTESYIVSEEEIKSLLPVKAPHYLILFSEEKPDYLTNAGYILQQLDLFLSANNIGSCWFGLARPSGEISRKSNLSYAITLAFGRADEKIHRKKISQFNRKSIEEIREFISRKEAADYEWQKEADKIIEAARLAPSATNNQPWYFRVEPNKIHVYQEKPGLVKRIFYKKMNKIDMGIVMAHLWLAAEHYAKKAEFKFLEEEKHCADASMSYLSTLKF